jgi:hypothetical protein
MQLPISSMSDLANAGDLLARSGMLGQDVTPAAGFVVACDCYAQGITFLQWLETYNLVHNRPAMRTDAILARFNALGGKHEILERSPTRSAVRLTPPNGSPVEFQLTWDEIKDESYTKDKRGNYSRRYATEHSRKQMLWVRLISDSVRAILPQACAGAYPPEIVEDFDDHESLDTQQSHVQPHQEETLKNPQVRPQPQPQPQEPQQPANMSPFPTAPEEPDYSVCPLQYQGKTNVRWADMEIEDLELACEINNSSVTPKHKEFILNVIAAKRGAMGSQQ